MSMMVRPKGKALKIAYAILGKPECLAFKPTKKQKEIDRELLSNETTLVR